MSWALSSTGKVAKVRTDIEAQAKGVGCADPGERDLAREAAALIDKFLVDTWPDESVTVNANGNLSVTSKTSSHPDTRRHALWIQIVQS
jgi:hypothetical protein